jgi:predicted adenylyl cyclase CyaB
VTVRRNLELKAHCSDLAGAEVALRPFGVRDGGLEVQSDTYFQVPHGRLKLRDIHGSAAVLIGYERPDHTDARLSAYRLVPVADAEAMRAVLGAALGIRGVVAKRRRIFHWHNVRIQLDEVARLGTFVELEAVLAAGDDEDTARRRLDELCHALKIAPTDHIAPSYADLLGL